MTEAFSLMMKRSAMGAPASVDIMWQKHPQPRTVLMHLRRQLTSSWTYSLLRMICHAAVETEKIAFFKPHVYIKSAGIS